MITIAPLFRIIIAALAIALAAPSMAHAAGGKAKDDVMIADPLAKKITGSKKYVSTFGIRASVVEGFTVSGFIAVDAGLDIESAKVRRQVQAIRPRVIDAMRQSLSSYANRNYIMGEAPNLEMMRGRMQRAVDRLLGPGEATVLFASVIVFRD